MIIAGNKIYDRCGNCGQMVQVNKFLFGSLHFCNSPYDTYYQNEASNLMVNWGITQQISEQMRATKEMQKPYNQYMIKLAEILLRLQKYI